MKVKTRTQEGDFCTKRFRHREIQAQAAKEESRLLQTTRSAPFLKRHELHHATDIYFKKM